MPLEIIEWQDFIGGYMEAKYKKIYGFPIHDFYHINSSLDIVQNIIFQQRIDKFKNDSIDANYNPFSGYEEENLIKLSEELVHINISLEDVLNKRKSYRDFSGDSISETYFSTIMKYSFGIRELRKQYPFYYYPCAGGFNSLRIYVIIKSVAGLEHGLYLYIPTVHALYPVQLNLEKIIYEKITVCIDLTRKCSFSIHIAGDMHYIGEKYSDRAYRFMTLEAGHAMQNLYLVTTGLSLGCVSSGGFMDGNFKEWSLQTKENYLLYEAFVGCV